MNQPFETEIITYRTNWRAELVNNQYVYIGGDTFHNNETTNIINNTPEWYNNNLVDNYVYFQNNNTMLWKLFDGYYPNNIQYNNLNNDITFDNTLNNWIVHDGTLYSHYIIVTEELNDNNLTNHLNMIREHSNSNNINYLVNNVRTELLQYMNLDG
tara:strand:+ start:295 stop:762 length:468 start_codon:yes stop_codon:yes gene_type:complete